MSLLGCIPAGFIGLLALEVIERRDKEATLKHPNTEWLLVAHESGPEVEDKPFAIITACA